LIKSQAIAQRFYDERANAKRVADAMKLLGLEILRARQHLVDEAPRIARPFAAFDAAMDRFGNDVVADRQEEERAGGVGPAQQHVFTQIPDREQLFVERGQLFARGGRQIERPGFRRD
jgi:hypothetical protein